MVEQGSSEEIPEDDLTAVSLTDPDLEQILQNAVGLGMLRALPLGDPSLEGSFPWGLLACLWVGGQRL